MISFSLSLSLSLSLSKLWQGDAAQIWLLNSKSETSFGVDFRSWIPQRSGRAGLVRSKRRSHTMDRGAPKSKATNAVSKQCATLYGSCRTRASNGAHPNVLHCHTAGSPPDSSSQERGLAEDRLER